MGMSFLEFRYTKQFFRKDCFFCGQKWHFVGFKCCDFSFQHIISLTRKGYSAEKVWVTKRKSCGGPRCPKTAMVTRFPSLQHRHLLSSVLGGASGILIFKSIAEPGVSHVSSCCSKYRNGGSAQTFSAECAGRTFAQTLRC